MSSLFGTDRKQEYIFINYLRVFACALIIIKHVAGSCLDYFFSLGGYDGFYSIILWSINYILWFAVNLFFMITGYIYLSDNKECTYKSISKNIIRLFLYLFIFGILFTLLLEIIGGRRLYSIGDFINILKTHPITIDTVTRSIGSVLTAKNQWGHMWFMYDIIKIYIILPIIKSFTKDNDYNIYILTGLLCLFNIFIPIFTKYTGISIYNFLPSGIYIIMTCIGGLLSKLTDKINKTHSIICSIVSALIIVFYFIYNINNKSVLFLGTSSTLIIILSILIFISFININIDNKIVRLISKCTLVIYLIHPMMIHIYYGIIKFNPLKYNLSFSIPFSSIIILAASFVIAYIIEFILSRIHNLYSNR